MIPVSQAAYRAIVMAKPGGEALLRRLERLLSDADRKAEICRVGRSEPAFEGYAELLISALGLKHA